MSHPCAWARLSSTGAVNVSPRAGHTLTPTSAGFVLFGGMDGRRNDQGNPSPNSDVYILKLGSFKSKTFEWHAVEIDPGSMTPPVRALHTTLPFSSDELFVFAGIHSTTPYQVLNDGWVLDVNCCEWKRCTFKTAESQQRGSYYRRMTGKITETCVPPGAAGGGATRMSITGAGHRRSAPAHGPRGSAMSFESLAAAASRVVADNRGAAGPDHPRDSRMNFLTSAALRATNGGGLNADPPSSPPTSTKKTWKRIMSKKAAVGKGSQSKEMKMRVKRNMDRTALMTSEEEQFHDDLLSMVTTVAAAEAEVGAAEAETERRKGALVTETLASVAP